MKWLTKEYQNYINYLKEIGEPKTNAFKETFKIMLKILFYLNLVITLVYLTLFSVVKIGSLIVILKFDSEYNSDDMIQFSFKVIPFMIMSLINGHALHVIKKSKDKYTKEQLVVKID